jgi:hypothetical protein
MKNVSVVAISEDRSAIMLIILSYLTVVHQWNILYSDKGGTVSLKCKLERPWEEVSCPTSGTILKLSCMINICCIQQRMFQLNRLYREVR